MLLDQQLAVLANAHRRQMLVSLAESNPQTDGAVVPAARDAEAQEQKCAIAMTHVHLPKLEAHGYVNWDRDTHTVTKGPQFDEIEPLLRALVEAKDDCFGDPLAN